MTTVAPRPDDVGTSVSATAIAVFLANVTLQMPTDPQTGRLLIDALRGALRTVEDRYDDLERDRAQELDRLAARAVNASAYGWPVVPLQRIAVTEDTPQDAA